MKHITRLRVTSNAQIVGELGVDQRGQIYFQYDTSWLTAGFDLSPRTMPFNEHVQLSPQPQEFSGLHGVFNDSLPDGWGHYRYACEKSKYKYISGQLEIDLEKTCCD